MLMYLSMDKTTSRLEDRMNPPVLTIIRALHSRLPAYHSIVALQAVSMGRVMKHGVRYGQVDHQVVNICPAPDIRLPGLSAC